MQLSAGSTIAGNMIWHSGNLNIVDDNQYLYHLKRHKIFAENNKPDVDRGDVINAASVNRPTINNEIIVSGSTSFLPRTKYKINSKEMVIQYTNQHAKITTTDGAHIVFPNISGTVITTGNYPTWSDIGGNDYLVQNGSSEIKPNNKHFVTSSSAHNILPFQDGGSKIGESNRRFNYGYFNSVSAYAVNGTHYSSQHNDSRFITFNNQSGFTHTHISGANKVKASDIILGYEDNIYSKTRNIVLNKPLVHSSGHVIVDANGKIDFSVLKNNNKVDKSGDTLTGNLLFDGTRSTQIEFKTDNQRTGSIKSTTSLSGQNYSNEILFTNNNGLFFKQKNNHIGTINESGFYTIGQLKSNYRLLIDRNEENYSPYAHLLNRWVNLENQTRSSNKEVGQINFVVSKGNSEQALSHIRNYITPDNDYWFEIGIRDIQTNGYKHFFKANRNYEIGIGWANPEAGYTLTSRGKIQAKSEIDSSSNDYTVATTKWVRSTAISEIDTLKRSISTNGVQTTQVTVSDKYNIINGSKRAELKYNGNNVEISNNQLGNLYYKDRLVYDVLTIPISQITQRGIVQLLDGISSPRTDIAATANSVKIAYDKGVAAQGLAQSANGNANQRVSKSGDTMTGSLTVRSNPVILEHQSKRLTLNTGSTDVFIHNQASNKYLQLKDSGILQYDNHDIYHAGRKPRFNEIVQTPTTISGYGITDSIYKDASNLTQSSNALLGQNRITSISGANKTSVGLLDQMYNFGLLLQFAANNTKTQLYAPHSNGQLWIRNGYTGNTTFDWKRIDGSDWADVRDKPRTLDGYSNSFTGVFVINKPSTNTWPGIEIETNNSQKWKLEFSPNQDNQNDRRLNFMYSKPGQTSRYIRFPQIGDADHNVAYQDWVTNGFLVKGGELGTRNLNDINAQGMYGQSANANATRERNYPAQEAGALFVCQSAYGMQQEYTTFSSKQKWVRGKVNHNNWGSWKRIDGSDWADVRDKPNLVTIGDVQTITAYKSFTGGLKMQNSWLDIMGGGALHIYDKNDPIYISNNGNKSITFRERNGSNPGKLMTQNTNEWIAWCSVRPVVIGGAEDGGHKWWLGTLSASDTSVRLNNSSSDTHLTLYHDRIESNKYVKAPDFYVTSDINLKKDLKIITDSLEKVKKLTGYKYEVLQGTEYKQQAGIIAQDLKKVESTMVKESDGYYHVNYNGVIALLIEAVKELDNKISKIENRNKNKLFGIF